MGNDGGSIPTRRELVKEAARNPTTTEVKATQSEQQEYFWSTDPISRKPLSEPIVSDCFGKLYNKDSVLEYLLSLSSNDCAETISIPITSLKDVVELHFSPSPSTSEKNGESKWICPITSDPIGPETGTKAIYLVPCGHVFSSTVIKEVRGEKCLVCESSYDETNAIGIIPVDDAEITRLQLRIKTLAGKGFTHSLKKCKKNKKRTREDNDDDDKKKDDNVKRVAGINNPGTKALTEKVMEEQRKKKLKMDRNENVKTLFNADRDQDMVNLKTRNDFMMRGYDIPANARR